VGATEAADISKTVPDSLAGSHSFDRATLVRAEQIRAAYRTIPESVVGAALAGPLVCVGMAAEVPVATLAEWLIALYGALGYALFLYFQYKRAAPAPDQIRQWINRLHIGNFLHGSAWGSAGIVMFQPNFTIFQTWLVLAVFCVALSTVSSGIVAFMPTVYVYVLPVVSPLLVRTAVEGGFLHWLVFAAGLLLLGFILYLAARMNGVILESFNLRFDNEIARNRAEEANRAKSRFLAAASHDLRQPLHAMALFVSALKDQSRGAESPRIVDHLSASVEALEGLFDALLDVSKLDAGIVHPEIRDFPAQAIFDRIGRECAPEAAEKGLRLRLMPASAVVRSDATLLERIVRNLVSNAIRYTNTGGVVVGCRRHGDTVRIAVYDSGVGIKPEHRADIFQEFYQVGNPERDRTKGLGLGLAIVDRLARLLDHPVTVSSVPGRGSVFSVAVPRGEIASAELNLLRPVEIIEGNLGGALIAVIDDEAAVRDGMREVLQQWGCRPLLAGSSDDALAQLAANGSPPAAVIADYRLRAGETGIAAIGRIRSAHGMHIPGVIITGDTAPDRLQEAEASGYHLLHKPVRPVQLRALLSFLLGPEAARAQSVV
jgi:signal transduction histidine kinase